MNDVYKLLEQYACDNYEEGGHWVAETFGKDDYAQALTEGGDIEGAKVVLRKYWELMVMRERECAYE